MAKWFPRSFLLSVYILMPCLIYHPCLSDAHQDKLERHYLHYMFTAWTKADIIPVLSAVGVVDDRQISDDSNEVPDLIRMILTTDDGTDAFVQQCDSNWYKHQLYILSNCTQCSELHTFQRRIGCEVEKFPNGTVMSLRAFDEYGFDGEDFIAFDYDTMLWIDKTPKAKETKNKWDLQTDRNQIIKNYFETCMDWISTFNNTHENSPDVGVFARKAPDDHSKLVLICLVTGFYPRDIEMNIRLNRITLGNQIFSEIRPNDDGSFQMRSSVKIDRNHKGSYDCHVIHSSLTEPVSAEWERHHFYYRFTVLSKAEIFPEFTAEAVSDDRQISHYNNEAEEWKGETLIEYPGLEAPGEPSQQAHNVI
ncbi:H-2 class I histocompatibility antigen, K-K alpha chain-like [Carassius auratus]|uniref:H-2 class I histocompatibility antigen, K-K alpha chain-like n=1 Tax=Carassius auratus TaxID=7957 RepID=A0A6P6LTW9_CARAU|nr:H-2 class I histocompatibility antigen, K-K alpha chain-like [Carassius auratus]